LCLEKRVFYRLMSGLQSSISTHIAKKYYYPPPLDKWGNNIPLFLSAVGSHPDRLNNLYFAFLFALRAAQKARHVLLSFPVNSGDPAADSEAVRLLREFFNTSMSSTASVGSSQRSEMIQECREGFDESKLFQVAEEPHPYGDALDAAREKSELLEDFRLRFVNISRIMNCVSCERCRVWGKLQITGIGTAIKVLLTDEAQLVPGFLDRQEVISLVNVLHQVCVCPIDDPGLY
jgi:ERO1-like protein alpha